MSIPDHNQAFILSPRELATLVKFDLATFIEAAFYELNPGHIYHPADHVEAIATALEQVRRGKIKRLIINLPPRHLKSHCVSVALPAFILGHAPSTQIICASYGQDLADDLALKCRRIMKSQRYRALFSDLLGGRQAISDFETIRGGRRLSTSVGGALTGRGADIIIIDDPQKADEALSESSRAAVNTWYDNTLLSRLNDKMTGAIIIVMQRLHQDDLVGHVLEQEGWTVLSLPAIALTDERHLIEGVLGKRYFIRKSGDILHPQREDAASLAATRAALGDFSFSAQYQQDPIPLGGAMIKSTWLQQYDPKDLPQKFSSIIQSWDTASKAGELNDYSVCTTWGIYKKQFYLLDVVRKRLNYPDLKREVKRLAQKYNPNVILIEDKSSGIQLIQDLKAEGILRVKAYQPPTGTDKIMRLHAQTALFENGLVHLPKSAPWLSEYRTEILAFPGSRYDDQVDSTTQCLDYIHSKQHRTMFISDEALRLAAQPVFRNPRLFW